LAGQRRADLPSYRGLVVGKRQRLHAAALGGQRLGEPPRLRFLAALIQTFESNQHDQLLIRQSSIVIRHSSLVSLRTATDRPPSAGGGSRATRRGPPALQAAAGDDCRARP